MIPFAGWQADIAFALRSMRRSPAFSAAALLTLILGIGATTAIFSVVYAVLFRPLPFPHSSELVHIVADDPLDPRSGVPYALFDELGYQTGMLQNLAVYYRDTGFSRITLRSPLEPESMQAGFVSGGFFEVLGLKPLLGRTFDVSEVTRSVPVAVIGEALWKRLGAQTDVLGKAIQVDGRPFTVIGVMPREFQFPARDIRLWLPITTNRYWPERLVRDNVHGRGFFMRWNLVARLRSGVSATVARKEIDALSARMSIQDRNWNLGLPVKVQPLSIEINGRERRALMVLMTAVLFVLLIACTNVANLMLARGASRIREMAIRTALGASRTRIARHVLTESLLLTSIAIACALLLAGWTIQLLIRWGPISLPRLEETRLDQPVFVFAVAVSVLSALLFGLGPAIRAGHSDPQEALKAGGHGLSGSDSRPAKLLIVAEFALAVVLVTSAGLLLRSLWRTQQVDLGFRPARILTLRIQPDRGGSIENIRRRLQSVPGVESVGAIQGLFELGAAPLNSLRAIEGEPIETDRGRPLTWTTVGGEYFETMGVPLVAGRLFSSQDGPNSKLVAIIDQAMAKRYWPKRDPIGRRFKGQDRRGMNDDWITVIGVVGDARRQGLEQDPTPHVFLSQSNRMRS